MEAQPGSVQGWPGTQPGLSREGATVGRSGGAAGAGVTELPGVLGDAGDLGVPGEARVSGSSLVLSRLISVVLMGWFLGRAETARGRNLRSLVRLSSSDRFLFRTCVEPELKTLSCMQEVENRRQIKGNSKQEAENRRPKTGDRKQEAELPVCRS